MTRMEAENLILSHEYYHFLEWNKLGLTSRDYQVPMISIGPLRLGRTGIRALSEIGAHGFAHTYHQLLRRNMESIEYLGRQLPLLGHYDTVVVGGGAAGAAAGIRCAIDGQKVLLVEKGAFLGGTASRALVCPMMPTYVEHLDVLHRVEETLNRHGVTTRDGITTMIWFAPDQLSDAF